MIWFSSVAWSIKKKKIHLFFGIFSRIIFSSYRPNNLSETPVSYLGIRLAVNKIKTGSWERKSYTRKTKKNVDDGKKKLDEKKKYELNFIRRTTLQVKKKKNNKSNEKGKITGKDRKRKKTTWKQTLARSSQIVKIRLMLKNHVIWFKNALIDRVSGKTLYNA